MKDLLLATGHDAVQKVTLIPRGQARGLTWFIPGEDPTLISKQQIFARIVGALGGRATEQVVFGDAEVTTGASSDLQQVWGFAVLLVSVSPALFGFYLRNNSCSHVLATLLGIAFSRGGPATLCCKASEYNQALSTFCLGPLAFKIAQGEAKVQALSQRR